MIRRGLPTSVAATADAKWSRVVDRIGELHARGRPILVGTRTVADSVHLSERLGRRGLPHSVLNALQDRDEAYVISRAGQLGQITVATNMAGRGTDIKLAPEVVALGGLHVIATERHDAGRIDRQLFGRSGRQGDPGSYEAMVSLEDELLRAYLAGTRGRVWRALLSRGAVRRLRLGRLLFHLAQRHAEAQHLRMRRDLLRLDEQVEDVLAFSGAGE
jgi:preprotein translocase subunit SecA